MNARQNPCERCRGEGVFSGRPRAPRPGPQVPALSLQSVQLVVWFFWTSSSPERIHNCKRSGAETATAAPKGCPGKGRSRKNPAAQGERTTERAMRSFIRMAGFSLRIFNGLPLNDCVLV